MAVIPFRPAIRSLSFPDENAAKRYLESLLAPFFTLQSEVWCRHLVSGNRLRIDYVAYRKPHVDFKLGWFGIEVKRSCDRGGAYNAAIKRAIDYVHCRIDDDREELRRINGERIERVFIFPARGDNDDLLGDTRTLHEAFWVNRLAGKFHVGMIYEIRDLPAFYLCADRVWCPWRGPRRDKHSTRQLVGSGVEWRAP